MNDAHSLGFLAAMAKAAEEAPKPKRPWAKALGHVGASAAGYGLGAAAGAGLSELADRAMARDSSGPLPPAVARRLLPAVGAAAALAYSFHKAREGEAVRNVLQGTTESGGHVR